MITIEGMKDSRVVKCILHRVADIPGGGTVAVAGLGGKGLAEGTPLGRGANGLYVVCKTARVLTTANASATVYEVNKGSHFNVGDRFATDGDYTKASDVIKDIDKSDPKFDVITLAATIGAASEGDVLVQAKDKQAAHSGSYAPCGRVVGAYRIRPSTPKGGE